MRSVLIILAVAAVIAGTAYGVFGQWAGPLQPGQPLAANADECALAAVASQSFTDGETLVELKARPVGQGSLYYRLIEAPRREREDLRENFPTLSAAELEALARQEEQQDRPPRTYRFACDWRALGSPLRPTTGYPHRHALGRPVVAGDVALISTSFGVALSATGSTCLYRRVAGQWRRQACGRGWLS